jgi:hypothetical protein
MGALHGYARAQNDVAPVADEARVHSLLLQRLQAKKNHQFEKADELRSVLLRECGVEIFDKTKFWRVVGGSGHVPLPQGEHKPRSKPPKASATPVPPTTAGDSSSQAEPLPSRQGRKKRRKKEKAAAAEIADKPIASGFGHALLLKMGWRGEGGLRDGAIAEPVSLLPLPSQNARPRVSRRGLSSDGGGNRSGEQQEALASGAETAGGEASTGAAKRKPKKRKAREEVQGVVLHEEGGADGGADGGVVDGAAVAVGCGEQLPAKRRKRKVGSKERAKAKARAMLDAAQADSRVGTGGV